MPGPIFIELLKQNTLINSFSAEQKWVQYSGKRKFVVLSTFLYSSSCRKLDHILLLMYFIVVNGSVLFRAATHIHRGLLYALFAAHRPTREQLHLIAPRNLTTQSLLGCPRRTVYVPAEGCRWRTHPGLSSKLFFIKIKKKKERNIIQVASRSVLNIAFTLHANNS